MEFIQLCSAKRIMHIIKKSNRLKNIIYFLFPKQQSDNTNLYFIFQNIGQGIFTFKQKLSQYTETCQKYSQTSKFPYIFHIKL